MTLSTPAVQHLFGFPIAALTMDEVAERCAATVRARGSLHLGVVNAAKVVNAGREPGLRDAVLSADLILADGQSVVWASRLLRRPLPERVAGIDIFLRLLDLADREGMSVYLLGGTPEVVATVTQRLARSHPGARIAGSRNGYFDDTEAQAVAADIAAARPDMLFLGITSPKKEIFLSRYGELMGVPVTHGVGGSFDVLAGVVRRAPARWQRLGLEWAYRLVQEPRRLWRRYLRTNTAFALLVLREAVLATRLATAPPGPRTPQTEMRR